MPLSDLPAPDAGATVTHSRGRSGGEPLDETVAQDLNADGQQDERREPEEDDGAGSAEHADQAGCEPVAQEDGDDTTTIAATAPSTAAGEPASVEANARTERDGDRNGSRADRHGKGQRIEAVTGAGIQLTPTRRSPDPATPQYRSRCHAVAMTSRPPAILMTASERPKNISTYEPAIIATTQQHARVARDANGERRPHHAPTRPGSSTGRSAPRRAD